MDFSLIRVMPSVSIGNPCALLTVHDVRFMINILLYLVSLVIAFTVRNVATFLLVVSILTLNFVS